MKNAEEYIIKIGRLIFFILVYIFGLVKANLLIARDILSLNPKMKPGIIRISMDARSSHEILALANLISMTPGTLSMDVSPDRRYIYVHCMYLYDKEKVKSDIKEKLEKRILKITR